MAGFLSRFFLSRLSIIYIVYYLDYLWSIKLEFLLSRSFQRFCANGCLTLVKYRVNLIKIVFICMLSFIYITSWLLSRFHLNLIKIVPYQYIDSLLSHHDNLPSVYIYIYCLYSLILLSYTTYFVWIESFFSRDADS